MSKFEKLKARLYTCPTDFTWEELITVLKGSGFEELRKGKTGGSRRKFKDADNNLIILHEPHPKNIVKGYAIREVVDCLKARDKKLKNEIEKKTIPNITSDKKPNKITKKIK